MDRIQTLHEKYQVIKETLGAFEEVPSYLEDNLAHSLRPYQSEAISRFIFYLDKDQKNKQLPVQLLFNMATGSGKTLVMAALMLELYRRGKRNFIFFVNSDTIIKKTQSNFLDQSSSKYLFSDKIEIDGQLVEINRVQSFAEAKSNAVNILFTTIQGLHSNLNNPRENRISYEELADYELVLLSDEAHHINVDTKNKKEVEDSQSWEKTVNLIIELSKENMLLEFTATIDWEDRSIAHKYAPRLIMEYDLKAFRRDGYSKDVLVYTVQAEDAWSRALQAIFISQYRKKVALNSGLWLKPVVMFKARTKDEANAFNDEFNERLKNLTAEELKQHIERANDILLDASDYFTRQIKLPINDLVEELKLDFSESRVMLIHSSADSTEKQLLLNSLEDKSNEIRVVISVDKLDEGWDVLNLFDIVRLYDLSTGAAGRPSKQTIKEAQLIGRGARYFPFHAQDGDDRYKRKFDNSVNLNLRALEQLHYHSKHNPRYIQELQKALKKSGIMAEDSIEVEIKLKSSFKKSVTYQKGVVWINKRIPKSEVAIGGVQASLFDALSFPKHIDVDIPSGYGQEIAVFGESEARVASESRETVLLKVGKGLPVNIVRAAINRNKYFSFDKISLSLPGIRSLDDFIKSPNYLSGIEIAATGDWHDINDLSAHHKLFVAQQMLTMLQPYMQQKSEEEYIGTMSFEAASIQEIFRDVTRKFAKSDSQDREFGIPQYQSHNYALDIKLHDWYAYEENYGTSEEKSLVVTLSKLIENLREKWSDVYLLRNEKAVTIYSFDKGRAFEPDYLLLANDKVKGNISWQVFIEPKGNQFLDSEGGFSKGKEGWKQDFLLQIEGQFDAMTLAESESYKVIGLPFYNEGSTKDDFVDQLSALE